MFHLKRTVISIVVFALLAAAALWAGHKTSLYSIGTLLRHDAESVALKWAEYLRAHPDELDKVIAGADPGPELDRFFHIANLTGRVFHYKLFDPNGYAVLDGLKPHKPTERQRIGDHHGRQQIAATVLAGSLYTVLKDGLQPRRPQHYGEVYVPIFSGDSLRGVIEVYVDQTDQAILLKHTQFMIAMGSAGLMFLCFLVPGILLLSHSRQRTKLDAHIRRTNDEDGLTRLMKRGTFLEKLQERMESSAHSDNDAGVMYVDLDRFKEINDTLGHAAGDIILKEAANRIRAATQSTDLLCSLGGDEFAVAMADLKRASQMARCAEQVFVSLSRPYEIDGKDYLVGVSIGISLSSVSFSQGEDLLCEADIALYQAKTHGRSQICWFEPQMTAAVVKRREVEAELRTAILEEQFDFHYQPYFDLASGDEIGREALLRWNRPGHGVVLPSEFIEIAEESGIIAQICDWALDRVCTDALGWPNHLKVAINISPVQFLAHDMPQIVERALAQTGLPAKRLEIEITEGLLLRRTENVIRQLEGLKALGVSIVLDDFGTGYSSLSYLTAFPYDKIKIDRSFVRDMERDPVKKEIIGMVVQLAGVLNVAVAIEGVETDQQQEYLQRFNGILVQGYFFGRPVADPQQSHDTTSVVPFPNAVQA